MWILILILKIKGSCSCRRFPFSALSRCYAAPTLLLFIAFCVRGEGASGKNNLSFMFSPFRGRGLKREN